jgi:hypothetical protein
MQSESAYTKGYLKGYEDAWKEALNEVLKLTSKHRTSRELELAIKSHLATVYQKVDAKRLKFQKSFEKPAVGFIYEPPRKAEIKKIDFTAGSRYLIKEGKVEKSLSLFSNILAKGIQGLCISRTPPDMLRKVLPTETVFLWLTRSETPVEEPLLPMSGVAIKEKPDASFKTEDLVKLSSAVKKFFSERKSGAILLEGVEYLIAENDFPAVLKFIHFLTDIVVEHNSYLVVCVEPQALEPKQLKQLEKEMSEII